MRAELLIPLLSLVAIGLLVGLASLLRLPEKADLGPAAVSSALTRFDPHARLMACVVTADGKTAFGRTADGQLVIARAMGIHPAVRAFRTEAVTFSEQVRADGVTMWRFKFGDPGFPDMTVPAIPVPPDWWPIESTRAPCGTKSLINPLENRP